MYRLQVKDHFDAAHQLKGYDGPCERLHGHRWDVEVVIEGTELDDINMLVDFKKVKAAFKELFSTFLDHYYLNDTLDCDNPTAEWMSQWLFEHLSEMLDCKSYWVCRVCVWESPDCCVKYYRKNHGGYDESKSRT